MHQPGNNGRSQWRERLKQRHSINRTCVAVANKNTRIVWALMTKPEGYARRLTPHGKQEALSVASGNDSDSTPGRIGSFALCGELGWNKPLG